MSRLRFALFFVDHRTRHALDEETERFIAIRKIKNNRLYELDKQAAAYGEYNAPPQVEMERRSLRDELGMMETAIQSPARSEVTDELGPAGRFLVNHQQNREIKQSIAALAVDLEAFIKDSVEWRTMHRQWLLIIGVAVVVILVIVVAFVTYIATKGAL
jgi:hypothetical protein